MREKLKSCPFCGSEAGIPTNLDGTPVDYEITDCSCKNDDCLLAGYWTPIKIWQTRPIEDDLRKRIAELEEKQRWRVVADGELPEKYRDETGEYIPFLVCEGDGGYPFRAMYDGINWGDGMFVPDITHWMPLPVLPESPNDTQTQTFVYGKDVSRSVK